MKEGKKGKKASKLCCSGQVIAFFSSFSLLQRLVMRVITLVVE